MKAKKRAKEKGKATGTSPHSEIQNSIDESFTQMKSMIGRVSDGKD